ncbi:MAG: MFS transporter [Archaeoglobaceae archaeon]
MLNFGISGKYRHLYPITAAILAMFAMIALIWSQFYPYIMRFYDLDEIAPIALSASISASGMLIFQIVAGFIADRFGPKLPMALAGACYLAGMSVISWMFSYEGWEAARVYWYAGSFIVGIGAGFYVGTFPVVIGRWFPDSPGRAFGITIFGQNISPLIMSPLAAYLITNTGLPNTFVSLGLLVFALMYLIGFVLWKIPSHDWLPEGFKPPLESGDAHFSLSQAVRDARFWILFTVMFSTAIGWFLILMNVATIIMEGLAEKAGIDAEYVAGSFVPLFMSVTAVGNAVGALAWGTINDRIGGPLRTLPLIYAIGGIMIVLFYLAYTNPLLILLVGILLYFALGGEPTVHFAAVPTFFGRKFVGRITTVLNVSVMSSAILGPYVGAFIRDQVGSYMWALFMAALLHFFAAAVVLVGRKYAGGDESVQIWKSESIRNRRS